MAARVQQPLALDSVAHSDKKGWRRNEELIDALPYVDTLSDDQRKAVQGLIEEEMRQSTKRPADYLKELPPMPSSRLQANPLLVAEMSRVAAGAALAPLDTTRYRLDPPPLARRNDYSAWRAALDNAHAQLEHQYNRLLNLELLIQFGPNAWRAQNESLEKWNRRLEKESDALKAQIDEVNRARKLQQVAAGRELAELEAQWLAAVAKNQDIELACRQLEHQVAQQRAALNLPAEGEADADAEAEQSGQQQDGVEDMGEG